MENITAFLFSFNWIDFLVIIVILFYALEGYSIGFYASILDLASFVSAFIFGLSFYSFFAKLLIKIFTIPQGFAKAIGFFVAAFLAEIIVSFILRNFVKRAPFYKKILTSKVHKTLNDIFGIFPSVFSGILLIAFILTMIMTLPLSSYLKNAVSDSYFGSRLVTNTQGLGKDINTVFGGAVNEGIAFFTVEPQSNETVNLNFRTSNVKVDSSAEQQMIGLVNKERTSRRIASLSQNPLLTKVARAHCQDMFKRGYFSHYTLEGLSPFDRMAEANIVFNYAGENLALAPSTQLAMEGLMQSPGHKENILSTNFAKIGIGAIDGGIYGEMFCQEFTD